MMVSYTRAITLALIVFISLCRFNLLSSIENYKSSGEYLVNDTIAPRVNSDTALKYYLALGDSYTIGQSVKKTERYPVQTVEQLRQAGFNIAEAEIIATSGWTTANLLDALKEKPLLPAYDMVTLLIGVNNQYQRRSIDEYQLQFTALLKKAIRLAGNRPRRVIVLSIPDYSVTPFAKTSDRLKIAREINSYNLVNRRISTGFHVNYLNVTAESRKAALDHSLIAFDDLHFSGKEYGIWTSLLVPMITQALTK